MTPAGSRVDRSTGAREPVRNPFGRGNRANQTSGTAPGANRPENRDRTTLTGGVGPGLLPAELPGPSVVAPQEIGEGRELPRRAAGRAASVNSDGSGGDTVREEAPAEVPGEPVAARATRGSERVLPWLAGVAPQEMRDASRAGSVADTDTSQRTVGSLRRQERQEQEVAGLQRQLAELRMGLGSPPPAYASRAGSVADTDTSQRTVGSLRRQERQEQEAAGLQRRLAESALREAAATREAERLRAAAAAPSTSHASPAAASSSPVSQEAIARARAEWRAHIYELERTLPHRITSLPSHQQ
jgi:hypothetical protein